MRKYPIKKQFFNTAFSVIMGAIWGPLAYAQVTLEEIGSLKHRYFAITAQMKNILLVAQHGLVQQQAAGSITNPLIIRLI